MDFMDRNVNGPVDHICDFNHDGKISPNEQAYINDNFYGDDKSTGGYTGRGHGMHIPDYEIPYVVLYVFIFLALAFGTIFS
jgi:hypothetical protein